MHINDKKWYLCLVKSFKLLYEYNKMYVVFTALISFIQGIVPTVLIVIMQKILNNFQKGNESVYIIIWLISLYIFLNIINSASQFLYSQYNMNFKAEFAKHINVIMLEKAAKLEMKNFEDTETYDVINRAQNQNGTNIVMYMSQIIDMLQLGISAVCTLFVLVGFKWWIFLIVIIVPIIRSVVTYIIDKQWYHIRLERTKKERGKWYINFLLMTGTAFKEVKINNFAGYLISKYKDIADSIIDQDVKMNKKRTVKLFCLEVFDWFIIGGLYIYTLYMGFLGNLLVGDVTAYIECINTLKANVQGIFYSFNSIVDQSLYLNMLFTYLEIPVYEEVEKKPIDCIEQIELKQVSFKYSNGKKVLKDINLTIKKGESIALVGENGSGKSTLIKLLLGLYQEYEGKILINGIELREIDLVDYQKRVGCVFQDYMKYQASVRENIAFGNIDDLTNDELIWEKLYDIGLKEKIQSFGGIDVIVGNWFGKEDISIGEWQRLSIARALIKESDFLVLDEPDASLDIKKQKEMLNTYLKIMQDKGSIYISHKVNYVHFLADKIYIMSNGEIIESGTHNDLMRENGVYSTLYNECLK